MSDVFVERSAALSEVDWDWYEAAADALVMYDDDSHLTIQGFSTEMRMVMGLFEEHAEVLHDDSPADVEAPGYRRTEALIGGRTYVEGFSSDDTSLEQVQFHQKEPGDFLWFLTNYALIFGVKIGDAVREYGDYGALDNIPDAALSTSERNAQFEYPKEYMWFRNSAQQLFEVVGTISNRDEAVLEIDDATKEALKIAAGRHVAAIALLAEVTFGVGLADIMGMNIQKLRGRVERGTVVRGNGDSR
jgi:hypothetical protein